MVDYSDLALMEYFFIEKGDITRWCQWDERRPIIMKEYPDLVYWLDKCLELDEMKKVYTNEWREYLTKAKEDLEEKENE